jgi:hypothetical protein
MPQARIAHQPRHASKALNSPIRIKIAASNPACGIRQPPARRKTAAIPPRAARPLLSMFGFISKYTRSVALVSPAKGNVSHFYEREDLIARLEFHLLDGARRDLPNAFNCAGQFVSDALFHNFSRYGE